MRVILIVYAVSFLGCSDEKPQDANQQSNALIVIEKHEGRLHPLSNTASAIEDKARQSTSLESENTKHRGKEQGSEPPMINRDTIREVVIGLVNAGGVTTPCSGREEDCPKAQNDKDIENLVTVLYEQLNAGTLGKQTIIKFIQSGPEIIKKKGMQRIIDECLEVFHVVGAHDLSTAHTESLLHQIDTLLDRASSEDPIPSEVLIESHKISSWPNQEYRSIIERIGRLLDMDIDAAARDILSRTAEETVKLVSGGSPGSVSQLSAISKEVTEARNDILLQKTTSVEHQRHLSPQTIAALEKILDAAH